MVRYVGEEISLGSKYHLGVRVFAVPHFDDIGIAVMTNRIFVILQSLKKDGIERVIRPIVLRQK